MPNPAGIQQGTGGKGWISLFLKAVAPCIPLCRRSKYRRYEKNILSNF